MQPTVAKVVLGERPSGSQRQQLIEGAILLRPVTWFFTLLAWKPLRDFREFTVDGPQRRERIAGYETGAGACLASQKQSAGPDVPASTTGIPGARSGAKFQARCRPVPRGSPRPSPALLSQLQICPCRLFLQASLPYFVEG